MDKTQTSLRERFIDACGQLEKQLEPEVFATWRNEGSAFIEAMQRGETCSVSALTRAIFVTIWAHVTAGIELDFPPELAAHYRRAPRAHLN